MIFGKKLSEYINFEKGFLLLILVVGLARPILPTLGVPNSVDQFLSLSGLLALGLLYYPVKVYTSGFGSYKQLLPVIALQAILAQLIIVTGIVIAIQTGKDNIYSVPEYSPNKMDGKTWSHAAAHLFGILIVSVGGWLAGSLIMFLSKRTLGDRRQTK